MKREKEVPADLLEHIKKMNQPREEAENMFQSLDVFCTYPVRAVKMRVLESKKQIKDGFRTAIIPAVDIRMREGTGERAMLKKGFLKRDALSYFIAGTRTVFPYGHVYANSGYVCLGNIFVPSAVPERSAATPLETLFLHNDRNLSHGNSHLVIDEMQADAVRCIMDEKDIRLSSLAKVVTEKSGRDIIAGDEIWVLSADVAEQRPLPIALRIMSDVYDIIFPKTEEQKRPAEGRPAPREGAALWRTGQPQEETE